MKIFKLKNLLTSVTLCLSMSALVCLLIFPAVSSLRIPQAVSTLNEVWQTVNENFYEPNFNGVDWKAVRKKYEPLAAQTKSSEQLSSVINQMLSELKTSHTAFYTQLEPAYYQLLGIFNSEALWKDLKPFFPNRDISYAGIGAFTKEINGKTFISAILDGSPAAKAKLKVGDQFLSVDGKKYQAIESFTNKVGKEVQVVVQRTLDPNKRETITVVPKKFNPTSMFLDAMRASTEVIQRGKSKIGYIHIWSYAGDQYQQQLEEEITYGKLRDADSLILDLREGWGGASPRYLSIFTAKVPSLIQIPRNGRKFNLEYQWKKPAVMLVNQGSRSGKEILAYGFKKYNIGSIIGTKTAGAVVGGRPFILKDGNLLYLAVVDVFVDGERLEGKGVTPDIEVPFQLEYAQGVDPQKEKAIEVLAASVNS